MKIIDTRIETMQIELLEASKEIKRCANCYSGRLLLDTLGGRFDTYTNPEEALANKAQMIRDIMDEEDSECDGSTCMRVSVVVDVFKRDNTDARFSACDENEVGDAIEYYYKARKNAESEEANECGFMKLEGLPFTVEKVVFHDAEKEKPDPFCVVIALTEEGNYLCGTYKDGCWQSIEGKVYDKEDICGPIVAWFYIPALHKINK